MFYARLSAGSGLMSDSTQQYILAKPISRDRGTDDEDFGGYYVYTGESSDAHAFIYPDGFDELFVPLDISAIEKQLDNIIQGYGAREYQRGFESGVKGEPGDVPIPRDKGLDAETVAEILVLFGLENTESEK